jgi:diguanylate cyclase (GGDEF)-like protein
MADASRYQEVVLRVVIVPDSYRLGESRGKWKDRAMIHICGTGVCQAGRDDAGPRSLSGIRKRFQGKWIIAFLLAAAPLSTAGAAQPDTLTALGAIHLLSNAQANRDIPVAFEATVTYVRGSEQLFVQDGHSALFVWTPATTNLRPGDRVLVKGRTRGSFRPLVKASAITLLRHGSLPQPEPATFGALIRSQYDAQLVTIHARVRAADLDSSSNSEPRARLQLLMDGGTVEARLDSDDVRALKSLPDDEVEVTGVAAGWFDNKMQQTGVLLYVSSLADIKILSHSSASPWSLPVTPMDQVLAAYDVRDLTQRVRVHGTITYYQPGSAVVLQDGSKSLWISTHTLEPLEIGDRADAIGFPDARDRILTLTDAEINDSHVFTPIAPQQATWQQLAIWDGHRPVGHQNDLVSVDGRVVTEVREASQDEYVVASEGRLFTAIYRHPRALAVPAPMRQIPLGSLVRVTGICTVPVSDSDGQAPGEEQPFDILLRSFEDIAVIANPPLLSIRNLLVIVGLLCAVLIVVGARSWTLDRQVRKQTAALTARVETEAALERRRSAILEDINGSQPLAAIIKQITALVSLKLNGAPCWCQVTDGALLGDCPADKESLRIAAAEIPARSGPRLGTIQVGFDPGRTPVAGEMDALSVGTRLATLAIETRKLYSDLKHRSEFDVLTEIHNRFSLERYLDAQIDESRQQAGVFGLIYIDLNEFKQVNDSYGHRVGDLYLRAVALRMKKQLRSRDMLARIGGDEFGILLPMVRSRAEVEEIARRLEQALDSDYAIEEYTLHGSASLGIAMFPEDGETRDSLLCSADASMYVAKQTRQHVRES